VHALLPIRPLSILGALRAPWLTLWDEASGRLVRFRDVDVEKGSGMTADIG